MKRNTIISLIACLLLGLTSRATAQVIDLSAGADTVVLRVGNYHYGFVQWQMSYDTIHFEDIEGAMDTVYRFLPTENGYYRAKATFSNCPPVYSPICHVMLPPKADAGPSRVLAEGDGAMLYGLLPEDCIGEWRIIEGSGGRLDNPESPDCYFIGTGPEYKLMWTVTNACGSDSDTITVRYVHTTYNDNFAVVDTTDFILSNDEQLQNGYYIIRFSDPVPHIENSTILIGIGDQGFLRKVIRYEVTGTNTYAIQTCEATLSDLIPEGAISIDYSDIDVANNKHTVFYRYPTRKEIMSEEYRKGQYIYIHKDKANKGQVDLDPEGYFTFDFGPIALSSDGLPGTAVPNATPSLKLLRNFVIDWERHGFHVDEFKFGFYNAQLIRELYFQMAAVNVTIPLIKKQVQLPHYFNLYFTFPVGGIPVCIYIVPSIYFSLSGTFQLTNDYTYYQRETITFTKAIEYRNNTWNKVSYQDEEKYTESTDHDGGCDIDFYIGPRLDFNPYEVVKGPYLTVGPYIKYRYCSVPNQASRLEGGARFTVGIDRKFFGMQLDFSATLNAPVSMYEKPWSLQAWSGNHQSFISGQTLANPIAVQVLDSKNRPVSSTFLRVEALDGFLSEDFLFTDDDGIAQSEWAPESYGNGTANAKIAIYNVDAMPVQGSPVIFTAYEQGSYTTCNHSDLTLRVYKENWHLNIEVTGGHPPYTYSTDGEYYDENVPYIEPYTNELYTIFVKDADGCVEEIDFIDPPINCNSNPVRIEVTQLGNTITLEAAGGEPPYTYSMDGVYYTPNNVFANLQNGDYVFYAQDANTCGDEMPVTINIEEGQLTVVTLPVENSEEGDVTLFGEVYAIEGTEVMEEGFCISRNHQPDFGDRQIVCPTVNPSFTITLSDGFAPHVTYYVRAYAKGANGVTWGNEESFTYEFVAEVAGYINGLFSVAEGQQVRFSQGNLQYIGNATTPYWKFADNQWEFLGNNGQGNASSSINRDLFSWATSGINHGAAYYQPWSIAQYGEDAYFYAYGSPYYNLNDQEGSADWGYNAIANGGNHQMLWRTLSQEEWDYLFHTRYTRNGVRYAKAKVNGVNGMILVPDNWDGSLFALSHANEEDANYNYNVIDGAMWTTLESNGVVFLPTSGYRDASTVAWQNQGAYYWSSLHKDNNTAYCIRFNDLCLFTDDYLERRIGVAVRLVHDNTETAMLPEVTTGSITDITLNSAKVNGNVVNDGGSTVIDRGICWNTTGNPTMFDNHIEQGTGTGSYTVEITGLTPKMTYYVRSYAVNQSGISYGSEDSFTTLNVAAPVGAIGGLFCVNDANRQVFFSKGNLQYIGSAPNPYWKFAENQWDYLGDNGQSGSAENVNRDLFSWGTSGYNHGAVNYQPWQHGPNNHNYDAYGNSELNLDDETGEADWGYNAIVNGGNQNQQWRTPTFYEWYFLLYVRNTATGIRFAKAVVNDVNGLILLPDNWDPSVYELNYTNDGAVSYNSNVISASDWPLLEDEGVVFLPAAGFWQDYVQDVGSDGDYWCATHEGSTSAYGIDIQRSWLDYIEGYRGLGFSVRLVQNYLTKDVTVTTSEVTDVEPTTAVAHGNVVCDFVESILDKGICYGTGPNPTTDQSHVSCGAGADVITANLVGLNPNTQYYVRAYAINEDGTVYGEEIVFSTTKVWENGVLPGLFSVSDTSLVHFSQGNLRFQASTRTWRFPAHQFERVGYDNQNISVNNSGWIDLLGWATSGNDHGAVCYQPWATSQSASEYYAYGQYQASLGDYTGEADWGHNIISNGGSSTSLWHTLTLQEFERLLFTRQTVSGIRFVYANVAGHNGLLLLPDDWNPNSYYLNEINNEDGSYGDNIISEEDWDWIEDLGAVFFPAAGYRCYGTGVYEVDEGGFYWTGTPMENVMTKAYCLNFGSRNTNYERYGGNCVRLVCPSSLVSMETEVRTIGFANCTSTMARTGGVVSCAAGVAISDRGICWSTSPNPTIANSHSSAELATCTFTVDITGLTPSTTYHIRAYAVSGGIVYYGSDVSFTTTAGYGAPEGALEGVFSVSDDKQVFFSSGNLQYKATTNTWRFAEEQSDYVGNDNYNLSSTYEGWIDLFCWGTSGYDHGAICYQPWSTSTSYANYYVYGDINYNLFDQTGKADWGYNAISNGGNVEGRWRTLTYDEWYYLLNQRETASGIRYAKAKLNGVDGLMIIPDNWDVSYYSWNQPNDYQAYTNSNVVSESDWAMLESFGVVFLPCAGRRLGTSISSCGIEGEYWTSTCSTNTYIMALGFSTYSVSVGGGAERYRGYSVRLVQDVTASSKR